MRRRATRWGVAVALLGVAWFTPVEAAPRALVVDYEMNPPVVLARLLDDLKDAGFFPVYRPYYPQITLRDLRDCSMVVVLSGNGPGYPGIGMTAQALPPLEAFVRRGGILILGPTSGDSKDESGDHDRYLFNLMLHRLGAPIRIGDDWITDDENGFAAPLYRAPFAALVPGHAVTHGLGNRMVMDRSPSLDVGQKSLVLAQSFPTAFPWGKPDRRGVFPLVAMAQAGCGKAVVASRHLMTWGGGNGKEPATPMLPHPQEEETLRAFLRNLFGDLYWNLSSPCSEANDSGREEAAPQSPSFPMLNEALPEAPPGGVQEVQGWKRSVDEMDFRQAPSHHWITQDGIRSGWAYINREPNEIDRLASRMSHTGMNLLWGVAFPQLLLSPSAKEEDKGRLMAAWERLAEDLKGSPVRWFLGMEFPGRHASVGPMTKAIGAEGREWDAPSPWDLEFWTREVVGPAVMAARWSISKPVVAGMVVDLEMYGRKPLFFGQGLDFGDLPFRAFLRAKGKGEAGPEWRLPGGERFPWLREQGLLGDYYAFLERRAEEMGRALREKVRSVNPDLVLGCYAAGILHRWFYRGLWRGMGEPEKPVVLFTFQRDVEADLAELRALAIHALHVRALLMGMMRRQEYPFLFKDALTRHSGYWLNRLTSLVATSGFLPIEAPPDMTPDEAWNVIRDANAQAPCSPPRR